MIREITYSGAEPTPKDYLAAIGRAGWAAGQRHKELVAIYGSEENLARAQTGEGNEFAHYPRSMFSVTDSYETALNKFSHGGSVYHARVHKSKLIETPVETSTENEYFIVGQHRMERIK